MATEHLGSEGGGAARGTSPVLLPDLLDPPCHLLRSRRRLKLALSSLKLIVLDLTAAQCRTQRRAELERALLRRGATGITHRGCDGEVEVTVGATMANHAALTRRARRASPGRLSERAVRSTEHERREEDRGDEVDTAYEQYGDDTTERQQPM